MRTTCLIAITCLVACTDDTKPADVTDTDVSDVSETGDTSEDPEVIVPEQPPLLERASLATHTCTVERPLTEVSTDSKLIESLLWTPTSVVAGVQYEDLTLARLGVDGAFGAEVTIDPVDYRSRWSSLAFHDGSIGVVWLPTDPQTGTDGNIQFARYASDDLAVEVAAKDLGFAGQSYNTQPRLVAFAGGFGLFWTGVANGKASLLYTKLSLEGVAEGEPVVIDESADNTFGFAQSVAYLNGGGYAVTYSKGPYDASEVFYAQLGLEGQKLVGPIRVSLPGGDGVTSGATSVGSANAIVQIGSTTYVTFTESVAARPDDFNDRDQSIIVRIAAIEGLTPKLYGLQAPVVDMESSAPSLYVVGGKLGVMWSFGTIIYICGGCIADFDMRFALLDPATLSPLADPVIDASPIPNGYRLPMGVVLADQRVLTTARIDFHAISHPAVGVVACSAK